MIKSSSLKLGVVALSASVLTVVVPTFAHADGYQDRNGSSKANSRLTIYFTRHAEKQTVTKDVTDTVGKPDVYTTNESGDYVLGDLNLVSKGSSISEVCGDSKCAEELSKKGQMRAMLLADWMGNQGILGKVDAVYATHKIRTQQTVSVIAMMADTDVVNVVTGGTELNPQSTTPSECATLQAIEDSIEAGHDTIVVAGHSGTLYDIMGSGVSNCILESGVESAGLGLDTGNTVPATGNVDRFPKDEDGKVANFGDLWKVVVKSNGTVSFKYRKQLDFARLDVVDTAR